LIGVARIEPGTDVQLNGLVDLACAVSLTSLAPSSGAYCFSGSTFFGGGAGTSFPFWPYSAPVSLNLNAHAPRGAFDHAHRGLNVVGVQVLHFVSAISRTLARRSCPRWCDQGYRCPVNARGLLDQIGGRRRLW